MVFIAKKKKKKLSFLINSFTAISVQIFILGGTNTRQQLLELIVLTERVWLTVFCFKSNFSCAGVEAQRLFQDPQF